LGSQHHHQEEHESEDAEGHLGEREVQPEIVEEAPHLLPVEDVRDQAGVDEREGDRADHHPPDASEPAEDDHREDEDREAELEQVAVHGVQEGAQEGAGDPAEGATRRVGRELGLDERDAHRRRRHLVLAQGDPRPPQA
jgi:hypothetical protein